MLSQRELKRLHVIQKVLDGEIKQVEAAEMLALSDRQIRRLIKRVRIEGDKGAVHKSRGKPSGRKISKSIRDRVIELYREKLKGFGPTLGGNVSIILGRWCRWTAAIMTGLRAEGRNVCLWDI